MSEHGDGHPYRDRFGNWFGMVCWNGLSEAQQTRLIEVGNLPFGYIPEGECPNGAEVAIETILDRAPGPRFYCVECGARYLQAEADRCG